MKKHKQEIALWMVRRKKEKLSDGKVDTKWLLYVERVGYWKTVGVDWDVLGNYVWYRDFSRGMSTWQVLKSKFMPVWIQMLIYVITVFSLPDPTIIYFILPIPVRCSQRMREIYTGNFERVNIKLKKENTR